MIHYYPSCNFRAQFPETAEAAAKYVSSKGVKVQSCCRVSKDNPEENDTILSVCTTCERILSENRKDCKVETVYDLIRRDEQYICSIDLKKHYVLQHCGKASAEFRKSAAALLDHLGFDYEISKEEDFCGRFMMSKISEANMKAAPEAFTQLQKKIKVRSVQEQDEEIARTADTMRDQTILVYCNSCYRSLKNAGADVHHLLDLLLMGDRNDG